MIGLRKNVATHHLGLKHQKAKSLIGMKYNNGEDKSKHTHSDMKEIHNDRDDKKEREPKGLLHSKIIKRQDFYN